MRQWLRRATAGHRALPDFLVLGAMKAGTTALIDHLEAHPDIARHDGGELQQFAFAAHRSEARYRAHFPLVAELEVRRRLRRRPQIVGEKTPAYLFHPRAPARAAALVPDAKLVALLREPIARTLSHYAANTAMGIEPLDLDAALDAEERRTRPELELLDQGVDVPFASLARYSYVARGRYAEQLDRWLEHYPPSQLLALRAEDLWRDPQPTLDRVYRFLGVETEDRPYRPANTSREPPPSAPATRVRLAARFAEPNADLASRYGITWAGARPL